MNIYYNNSMKKLKYYAIKDPNKNEKIIYTDWIIAQEYIRENKIKEFKSFLSQEEALAYLDNKDYYKNIVEEDLDNYDLVAYSDGSFSIEKGIFSYGVVLIEKNKEIIEYNNYLKDNNYSNFNNIAGELFGVISIINYALKGNYKKILINYDYMGIEKWALGVWKTNNTLTQRYYEFYNKYAKNIIEVDFRKVKAHSNNKYNDMVDNLAKMALNNDNKRYKNDKVYVIVDKKNYTNINDLYNILKKEYVKNDIFIKYVENEKIYIQNDFLNEDFLNILLFLKDKLEFTQYKIVLNSIYNIEQTLDIKNNLDLLKLIVENKSKNISKILVERLNNEKY